ncbi:MAG: bifunctional demethylmenaquinone methyltransferase/2-methoxy-6-polyprenyl-1,4-benzoquinol methylase UbiE [Thermodesulfobacteriota bacterium]
MAAYFLQPDSIRRLFDTIAPSYDLLNHLLSLRRDCYWRKRAVRELNGFEGWILDIATGTGDVAIEIVNQSGPERKVFGLDFSAPMIRRARQKVLKKGISQKISLSLGDALTLPFRGNTFAASMMAFGLRNIVRKEEALAEMVRVIKKGGKVIILEFTLPRKGLPKTFYPLYFEKILPWVGGLISGDREAYAYLPQSVHLFRYAENYEALMRRIGLKDVVSYPLTGGIATVISGMKSHS